VDLTRQALRTPAAAAIAGILFAVLFSTRLVLIRLALPENPGGVDFTAWLAGARKPVTFALTLVPFAGIAFLWFMGVLRDRLGELEDRFFSAAWPI